MPTPLPEIISVVAAIFSVIVLVLTIRKMRQESAYSRIPPLIGLLVTALITALYIWITGVQFNLYLGAGLVVLGLAIGYLQGRTSRVYRRDNKVMVKRTVASMILWGAAYLLSLALTLTQSTLLAASGVLVLLLALGINLGTNLNLLVRATGSVPPAPSTPTPAGLPPRPTSLPR